MATKFRLLKDEKHTRVIDGVTLYRIQATRTFALDYNGDFYVNEGDLGGFVEHEDCLSHEGRCWIGGDACVMKRASVEDHAYVGDSVIMYGGYAYDRAVIRGRIRVKNSVNIMHDANIIGDCDIHGTETRICGNYTDHHMLYFDGDMVNSTFYSKEPPLIIE